MRALPTVKTNDKEMEVIQFTSETRDQLNYENLEDTKEITSYHKGRNLIELSIVLYYTAGRISKGLANYVQRGQTLN